ncbi:MAG: hypothetical protein V3R66_05780 [Rhodospirillales bacterium]
MNTEPENEEPDGEEPDAAWVTIETPFDAEWLRGFVGDIECLFRINSLTEFEEMRQTGEGQYHLKIKNLGNGKILETDLKVTADGGGVEVSYSSGLKSATRLQIEPKADGTASLVITDYYGGTTAEEREARIDEVDNSLVQWGHDIHRYLKYWNRWSWIPGWRWYMRRFWQSMKPSARRICFMLFFITLVEFVFFLFVFLIFWLELNK